MGSYPFIDKSLKILRAGGMLLKWLLCHRELGLQHHVSYFGPKPELFPPIPAQTKVE